MFSVRTENILLNYFVLLFTIGLLFIYSFTLINFLLLLLFVISGLFLFFDRYFFFKQLFLLSILTSILFLFYSINYSSILVLLVLFISVSQICLSFTYFLLFPLLYFYFDFWEIYFVISILIITLIFTFWFSLKKLNDEFNKKVFSNELRYRFFKHDLGNLCSIMFLQNRDKKLEPILEEIRVNLSSKSSNSKTSIAGLLRKTVYFLNYDYNLKICDNFFLNGDDFSWFCFFYNLLGNYGKTGCTVVIENNSIFIQLKKEDRKKLKKFLKEQFTWDSVEIEADVLKFNY